MKFKISINNYFNYIFLCIINIRILPKNLQYQNKVESTSARQHTSHIQPQTGTLGYTNGNRITINIPTSPNTILVVSERQVRQCLQIQQVKEVTTPTIGERLFPYGTNLTISSTTTVA